MVSAGVSLLTTHCSNSPLPSGGEGFIFNYARTDFMESKFGSSAGALSLRELIPHRRTTQEVYMRHQRIAAVCAMLFVALCFCLPAAAQTVTGTLSGTITDTSG